MHFISSLVGVPRIYHSRKTNWEWKIAKLSLLQETKWLHAKPLWFPPADQHHSPQETVAAMMKDPSEVAMCFRKMKRKEKYTRKNKTRNAHSLSSCMTWNAYIHSRTHLPKKKLSKYTTNRPHINCSGIFCSSKYKFWSPIISWANIWYVGFTWHLN